MNFKTHFYQTLVESPDKTRAGIRYTNWEQPDARTFIISPEFYCITTRSKITHASMLGHLLNLVKERGLVIDKELLYNQMWVKGDLSSLKPLFGLKPEQLMYRSNLMRYSQSHGKNILVGRLWLQNKVVSVWNNKQDISMNPVNQLIDLIGQKFQTDATTFMWEVFEKTVEISYTVDELEKIVGKKTDDTEFNDHQETQPQWNQLHLTPPDQKGRVMKNMGIKPRAPLGAEARYLRGESYEF
jgi:hypothetical protein